jgi:hypothetical protein
MGGKKMGRLNSIAFWDGLGYQNAGLTRALASPVECIFSKHRGIGLNAAFHALHQHRFSGGRPWWSNPYSNCRIPILKRQT